MKRLLGLLIMLLTFVKSDGAQNYENVITTLTEEATFDAYSATTISAGDESNFRSTQSLAQETIPSVRTFAGSRYEETLVNTALQIYGVDEESVTSAAEDATWYLTSHQESSSEDEEVFHPTESNAYATLKRKGVVNEDFVEENNFVLTEDSLEDTSTYLRLSEENVTGILCSAEQFEIVDVHIDTGSDSIQISWQPHRHIDKCEIKYDVNITSAKYDSAEIPYFRQEINTSHNFSRLQECTAYNVSIQPNEGQIFQKTIRTLPGRIENLNVTIANNKTRVHWSPSKKPDCFNYRISRDGGPLGLTTMNSYEFDGDLYCTRVGVEIVDKDNRSGVLVPRAVPGPVLNLRVTPSENGLNVAWEPPTDITCVTHYKLQRTGSIEPYFTNETQFNFTTLEACTSFIVEVAAVSNTNDASEFVNTTTSTTMPDQINQVTNLKLTLGSNALVATWNPPTLQEACITRYQLEMWSDGSEVTEGATTINTNYTYSPLIGCMTYNVQVKPVVSDTKEGNTDMVNEVVGDLPMLPPTFRGNVIDKTWSQMTFAVGSYITNMCRITRINVQCEALSEDNEDFAWIVRSRDAHVDYGDSNLRPTAVVNVTELSEFTNYTCHATVTNSWGESEKSAATKFQTDANVPSVPQNLTISEVTSAGFMVMWERPYTIPGIFTNYYLNVMVNYPLHYIPSDCTIGLENISLPLDATYYRFENGLPNINYTVSVVAATTVGAGLEAVDFAVTLSSGSQPPREMSYNFEPIFDETDKIIAVLEWLLPCNTNGDVSNFQMAVNGTSLVEVLEDHRSIPIPINEPVNDTMYRYSIENLLALANYTVTVYAVSTGNIPGDVGHMSFISPEGFPSAPIITNVSVSEVSVTITWDEPATKNGRLQMYSITITTIGPLHFIPDDCVIDYEDRNYNVSAEQTSFTFEGGLPNFNYTVTVTASTSAGFGEPSKPEAFRTLESGAEAPRNLSHDLKNTLGDTYVVVASLNWTLPCNTNGNLSHFQVDILGESLDAGDDDVRQEVVQINDPIVDLTYSFDVESVQALRNYTIAVTAVGSDTNVIGKSAETTFLSPDGLPSSPTITAVTVTDTAVTITWQEPLNKNGMLQTYTVLIESIGALHFIPVGCVEHAGKKSYNVSADESSFVFLDGLPNYNYTVEVAAATSAGFGLASNSEAFQTLESYPDVVRDFVHGEILYEQTEMYDATVSLSFLQSCNLNGIFESYQIKVFGMRSGFDDINEVIGINDVEKTSVVLDLKPEYIYVISLTVYTHHFRSNASVLEPFTSPAGVPPGTTYRIEPPYSNASDRAIFVFSSNIFDRSSGNILYYSIILSGLNQQKNNFSFGFWDGTDDTWPLIGTWTETGEILPYQATPIRWNPFLNRAENTYVFVIGEENCTNVKEFCNGPLRPSTRYTLTIRGFTSRGFRDAEYVAFITPSDLEESLNLALILGVVFGILATVLLLIFIFVLWRRRKKQKLEKAVYDPLVPPSIPIKHFPTHYADLKENLNKLKSEYTLLETKSAECGKSATFAVTDENKKKNRYINILPYDDTRVKLDTDKNANYSDYINASFIKGYSGTIEYIATQGPLEATAVDFWRMVMQEDVTVIVMVAQFVEQGKQKCYKYIPNNQETKEIGDGIEIRCSNELNFGCYTVRSLLVQRELNQWKITHLQYTDWPDFGCPNGTQSMLEFCNVMRTHIEKNKSKTVVHCSAGVGRTGTLIAVDILLQTVENNADLNIFKTVYSMRKQRSHMVQTEKQYLYILTCINDHILNMLSPLKVEANKSEPIYENINILQTMMAESAL